MALRLIGILSLSLIACLQVSNATVSRLPLDDKMTLLWTTEGSGKDKTATFTIEAEVSGWVGIGFSPKGGMTDADIIMAWVAAAGEAHVEDRYALGNELPKLDDSSDVTLVSGEEVDGKTVITFQRKVNTCDEDQDRPILSGTTRLIYAYGDADPNNNIITSADYHRGQRGGKSIYLLDPAPQREEEPADALTYDFVLSDYDVPENETTYHCSFHDMPPGMDKEHHITAIDTIITPGNEDILHHAVLHACWGVDKEHMRGSDSKQGLCSAAEMPEFIESCHVTAYAWVVGGTKFYYPKHAGYLIGSSQDKSPQFFMVQLHYNNPEHHQGRKDSSGIRITYTPTLREHDVGNLRIGDYFAIFSPPKAEEFRITAYCHSSCTREFVPPEGLNIFSYMLHAHLTGMKIQVDWYRDGVPLEVIASDDSYDFNYQENRLYESEKKLLPGDSLKITCFLDTSEREKVIFGGESAYEEMCLAFFMYYPQRPISTCESNGGYADDTNNQLYKVLGKTPERNPEGSVISLNYRPLLSEVDWTDQSISKMQEVQDRTDVVSICRISGKETYPAHGTRFSSSEFQPPLSTETETDVCQPEDQLKREDHDGDDENGVGRLAATSFTLILTLACILLT